MRNSRGSQGCWPGEKETEVTLCSQQFPEKRLWSLLRGSLQEAKSLKPHLGRFRLDISRSFFTERLMEWAAQRGGGVTIPTCF